MTDVAGVGPLPALAPNRKVIVWFRRDLRLADNPALVAALRMAPEVVPVYVWAPEEEGQFQPGRCSRWWLYHSLVALSADLRALGTRLLCFRAADSRALLARLAVQLNAQAVLFNHLYDPISMVRDNEVKAGLAACGIFCQSFNADVLREPWEVLDAGGKPFTCYDAFWAAHCAVGYPPSTPLPIPGAMPPLPPGLEAEVGALSLPELGIMTPEEEMSNAQLEYHWQPGSAGAHRVLDEFVRAGRMHAIDRDRAKTDRASTSRLSPHIHHGEISVRHIHYVAKQKELEWARAGDGGTAVKDFLRQLGYREYSRYLSFHFPFTHERSLLEHLRVVPWRFDQRLFKAWRQGRTGYPLVDASMRELWSTGWMHNRMRVVAASFLVKNLLLPWQWGLKHYWDALLDADLECDALGWQYVAGCMSDAHEFSYTIDHASEAKRFDPDGNYVRRWLPVLARLPSKYIHEPWTAPDSILDEAGIELGCNYPYPVMGVEESQAALMAADAVVQACLKGGAPPSAPVAGPFRPGTEADPAEAERLFEANYRQEILYGVAPVSTAPGQDRAEGCGTSEDVQSNAYGSNDADLGSTCQPGSSRPGAVEAAVRRWGGTPSSVTANDAAASVGAASAALGPQVHAVTGKRTAAALAEAVAGGASSEGTEQQADQPSAAAVPQWQPLNMPHSAKATPRGSGAGTGTGTGTGYGGLAGLDPSMSGDGGPLVPQMGQSAAPAGLFAQPYSAWHRQVRTAGEAGHGSNSPSVDDAVPATARVAGMSADTDPRWPPPLRQQQKHAAALGTTEHRGGDVAPAGLKRQRAGSPSRS